MSTAKKKATKAPAKKVGKSKGGRPKGSVEVLITPMMIGQIQVLSGYGLTVQKIAAALGISKKTLERRASEDGRVSDALEKGRAVAATNVAKTAYELATSGQVPAMTMFWLKCREGWKETTVHEHTGKDGQELFNRDQLKSMAQAVLDDDDEAEQD